MWQKIKNYYHLAQALFGAVVFNFPSKQLIVIGVTGTDGKTTAVSMIYHILKSQNKKVSMISSVNAVIGPKTYQTGFHVTTPSPFQVQKFLHKAKQNGSQYFILEATSHGLDQNRLAFVDFKIAAVTNITHEHLDYHKSWESYAGSKAKLVRFAEFVVLNKDDKSYGFLKNKAKGKILTYSQHSNAHFNLNNFKIKLKIPGSYNLSNALAAAAVVSCLNIPKTKIIKALASFKGVLGRMENIDLGQTFKVFVDFAHTPNGLLNALQTLRSEISDKEGRLIIVFGSAGLRDKSKRSIMGRFADENADIVILTAEDPRTEDVKDICSQIALGIKDKKLGRGYFLIPDRKQAIEFAVGLAKKNDVVATFGKSHEKSMCYGKKEFPWDEFKAVREAIKAKLKK